MWSQITKFELLASVALSIQCFSLVMYNMWQCGQFIGSTSAANDIWSSPLLFVYPLYFLGLKNDNDWES